MNRRPAHRSSTWGRAHRSSDGANSVELVIGLLLMSMITALTLPILMAVSTSATSAEGDVSGSAWANLAVQSLVLQIGSASEICLPTQMTNTGPTVTSGFAVRVLSKSFGGTRWDQWMVNPTTTMLQEQEWPTTWTAQQAVPPWVTVAGPIKNLAAPFALATAPTFGGPPASLKVTLAVAVSAQANAKSVTAQVTIAALNTPYTSNSPPQPCATTMD